MIIVLHNSLTRKEKTRGEKPPSAVKCGELSRAARVLTSHGLAPPSEESIQRLRAKHPAWKMSLNLSGVDEVSSIQLKKSVFLNH